MHLLALFQWLSHSPVGHYMQKSTWAFAVAETIHLLALAALGGSLLIVSLRTLGVLRQIGGAELAAELLPVTIVSLAAITISGVLMLSEESLKCYYSPAFRAKMAALAIAVAVSVPVHLAQAQRSDEELPWWVPVGAAVSLLAWLSVAVAGRTVGFL
jgi:hypothetical protein